MRLADFILAKAEPIVAEWEQFARGMAPGRAMGALALRDHADDILHATARDMASSQSVAQRFVKSKGQTDGDGGEQSVRLDDASALHAIHRVGSGFDLLQVVSEYRALRASVIRLWRQSDPHSDARDLDDLARFGESIDQSIAKAISSYTKRVDQSRQMFLAILGHDLRNPLNSIAMSAQVWSLDAPHGSESAGAASQVSTSAAVMGRMVSDLLDYTRTRLGAGMPVSPAPMDLDALCREVFAEFRAGHPHRDMRFRSAGPVAGEWDAARLRQAVSNLLANAFQHSDEGVSVDLSLNADALDAVLAVHNGGPPIAPASLPTLFDPLVHGASPELHKKRRPGSIGLGLYIAREVVTAHGGSMDVHSTEADGTTFTIRLPRHQPAP